jgi:hypothetical protein
LIFVFAEAKARILGQADLHVKTGSTISLSCVISQGPHDLGTVFWYHGPTIIDYDSSRGGVKIETEWTEELTSRLRITNARITDSGNYTCIPTIAAPASVMVHVINGQYFLVLICLFQRLSFVSLKSIC